MRKLINIAASAVISALAAAGAHAQEFPTKPVRMVVPFAPGGSVDALGRLAGQKLGELWGKQVVIDHRPGAGGNVGAEVVARSAPDGYTMLVGGIPHAIGVTLYPKLSYDFAKDLVAIGNIAVLPSVIVLHPSLPVKTVKELIALAAARPGQLNYGSGGVGSPNQMALELFKHMAKVNMVHVPYKGGGQVVGDLIAGHIQLASLGIPPALRLVQAGKLRAIAVTGSQRSPVFQTVPTVAEAGLPGFDVSSWYGLFAPAGTPAQIILKVNKDLVEAVNAADIKKRFGAMGADPSAMRADEFSGFVQQEISKWEKVIKASGIK